MIGGRQDSSTTIRPGNLKYKKFFDKYKKHSSTRKETYEGYELDYDDHGNILFTDVKEQTSALAERGSPSEGWTPSHQTTQLVQSPPTQPAGENSQRLQVRRPPTPTKPWRPPTPTKPWRPRTPTKHWSAMKETKPSTLESQPWKKTRNPKKKAAKNWSRRDQSKPWSMKDKRRPDEANSILWRGEVAQKTRDKTTFPRVKTTSPRVKATSPVLGWEDAGGQSWRASQRPPAQVRGGEGGEGKRAGGRGKGGGARRFDHIAPTSEERRDVKVHRGEGRDFFYTDYVYYD